MTSPLRLGLFDILQVDPTDPAGHAEVYRRRLDDLAYADELGFEVAFTAERHFMPGYRCPAPGAWLGAASQRTRRLRLGVLAYTLPIHEPAALAEEVAVLDHLSGGRLEIGVGLGHRPEELVALGVEPAQRIAVFQERLAVLRALWSGGQVTLESAHTRLREVAVHPLTLQEPHPPLWYAGTDTGAAAWAAGQGLNLAVGFAPTERLRPTTTAYAAQRQLAKSDSDAESEQSRNDGATEGRIALMRHAYVAESDEHAWEEVTDDLLRLQELRLHPHGHAPVGEAREGSRADRLAAARESAERLVRDEVMILGGPATVAAALRTAADALRLDLFLANAYAAGVDDARVRRTLRLLATEVVPRQAEHPAGGTGG
jgi:alkanesulfonate monooxygenase SsuD/methylene tetrahydromethanopterin reductase-like flavin-dependent oxidoreductase (luciferase family)